MISLDSGVPAQTPWKRGTGTCEEIASAISGRKKSSIRGNMSDCSASLKHFRHQKKSHFQFFHSFQSPRSNDRNKAYVQERVGAVMTRREVRRSVAKAIFISVLIQVPFIFLLNFGVHSVPGTVGYLFYYLWILVLESLYRTGGGSWQNNWLILQTRYAFCRQSPCPLLCFS